MAQDLQFQQREEVDYIDYTGTFRQGQRCLLSFLGCILTSNRLASTSKFWGLLPRVIIMCFMRVIFNSFLTGKAFNKLKMDQNYKINVFLGLLNVKTIKSVFWNPQTKKVKKNYCLGVFNALKKDKKGWFYSFGTL